MRRRQGGPRVHLSFAQGDSRLYEQLARHLATASIQGDWKVSSPQSIPAGERTADRELAALVHADVVVLLATARFFDDPAARGEMDLALKRFLAGEIHLLAVHAADCLLDARLAGVTVVAPESFSARNREQFWRTCAARIALLCESVPPGKPRYEDEDNRAAGEAMREIWWTSSVTDVVPVPQLTTHQEKLRLGGRLRPGDILGYRFHVRRRLPAPIGQGWEGYDFVEQRPVEVRLIQHGDVPRWLEQGAETLRRYVEIQHPAIVRMLTTLREEPGITGAYFVMERFTGAPLHIAVLDGRISAVSGIDTLGPVAEALTSMHSHGVVHGALTMDAIRVSAKSGRPLCKLEWPVCSRAGGVATPLPTLASMARDAASFSRLVLACLHGAMLPDGASAAQLRHILHMSEARPELKALLARNLGEDTARPADLTALARLLRDAQISRTTGCTGWFDLEMRPVPGGATRLGARPDDERARPIEMPARRVIVQGFELCAYPVTQRLYTMLMGTNPSTHVDACAPVHNVTFFEALQFCNRLSIQRGLQPVYVTDGSRVVWRTGADGYRLPTEAEWEHAAKGSGDSLFPWGETEPGEHVCWNGPGNALGCHNRKGPSPVWNHPESATPTGLFDMAGNVWEWCWDWFAPYADWIADDEPLLEPLGPSQSRLPPVPTKLEGGAYRVLRGGAWNVEDAARMRTTTRSTDLETVRDPDIGFRVARGPKPLAREIQLRPEALARMEQAPAGVSA